MSLHVLCVVVERAIVISVVQVGTVWVHEHVGEAPQLGGLDEGFDFVDVQDSAGDGSFFQGLAEVFFVDAGAASDVHKDRRWLHFGEDLCLTEEI